MSVAERLSAALTERGLLDEQTHEVGSFFAQRERRFVVGNKAITQTNPGAFSLDDPATQGILFAMLRESGGHIVGCRMVEPRGWWSIDLFERSERHLAETYGEALALALLAVLECQ